MSDFEDAEGSGLYYEIDNCDFSNQKKNSYSILSDEIQSLRDEVFRLSNGPCDEFTEVIKNAVEVKISELEDILVKMS